MKKLYKNESGFSVVEGLLVLIVVLVVGFIGYYVWNSQRNNAASSAKTKTNSVSTSQKETATESSGKSCTVVSVWSGSSGSVCAPNDWKKQSDDSSFSAKSPDFKMQPLAGWAEYGYEEIVSGAQFVVSRYDGKTYSTIGDFIQSCDGIGCPATGDYTVSYFDNGSVVQYDSCGGEAKLKIRCIDLLYGDIKEGAHIVHFEYWMPNAADSYSIEFVNFVKSYKEG